MVEKYHDGELKNCPAVAQDVDTDLLKLAEATLASYQEHMDKLEINDAIKAVWGLVASANKYIDDTAPWKLAKEPADADRLHLVLYNLAEVLRFVAVMIEPFIPGTTPEILRQLGLECKEQNLLEDLTWGGIADGTKVVKGEPLYPRIDVLPDGRTLIGATKKYAGKVYNPETGKHEEYHPEPVKAANNKQEKKNDNKKLDALAEAQAKAEEAKAKALAAKEAAAKKATSAADAASDAVAAAGDAAKAVGGAVLAAVASARARVSAAADDAVRTATEVKNAALEAARGGDAAKSIPAADGEITIDDFAKIDLRVAKILSAERVPKTDKLMKIQVQLGEEERTIVSGIAQYYTPEELVGRNVIVIKNLKPTKLRGIMSYGMLLAASDGEGNLVLADAPNIKSGSKVK